MLDASASERAVSVCTETTDTMVFGDHDRIVEILSNLVGNAIKFTPRGGRVVVRTDAGDGVVKFVVEDAGPGIAGDQIPHLFERFWQGSRSTGGLGLGLYICKKLVEAQHGSIGVTSEVGRGSSFWFTLPVGHRDTTSDDISRPRP